MSLHNFNPNNKSWKMYSNTITSISGDNLTIKPYDGKNLLLEVSGNNNIFFKKGDISYGLDDLIDTNITLTSVSGDIIPSNDNAFKLGDVSKNWSNAYIRDLSVSNISVSENFILNISGSMTNITDIFNNLGNTFDTIGTSIYNIEDNVIDLSNNKAPLANPTFTGTVVLPSSTSIGDVTSNQLAFVSGATSNIQAQLDNLSNKEGFYGTIYLINNISTSSEIYNFVLRDNKTSPTTISAGIFTNPATTITISVAENSELRLLRPYYEYNIEYLYNNTTLTNIMFDISGGTYRSANNKYYFTPNNNNINNGVLTLTSTLTSYIVPPKTGFWGTLIVHNVNGGNGGRYLDYQWLVNGTYLNPETTRIYTNNQDPITISEIKRLTDINVQLTLNVSFESYSAITNFNFNGATIVSGNQNQTILTANSNNLTNGTINIYYTINNTYVEPPPPPPPPEDPDPPKS